MEKIPKSGNFYPPLTEENDPFDMESEETERITKESVLDTVQNE